MSASVILICDDDPRVARALSRQLTRLRLPLQVEIDDRCQMVERARALMPSLVVLDMLQPIPGLMQLEELRRDPLLRDIPVVAVSAVDDDEARRACDALGVIDFVVKPFADSTPEKLALLALRSPPDVERTH